MRIVVALGGNALLEGGEGVLIERQVKNVERAAIAIAPVRLAGHEVVITHGNGPQIGMLAMQAAATPDTPYPLDALDAESEGMIGHLIEQGLMNVLPKTMQVATLLTQVRVDRADPAFRHPTNPIGALYGESEARTLAAERGWRVARDGKGWRRVVASPKPLDILEMRAIKMLIDSGATVICAGGGGIPVVERDDGTLHGVEGVVDKDYASALLARKLDANWLVMVTDVDGVYQDYGTARARRIDKATPSEILAHRFAEGSMAPKVEAACDFVNETGGRAAIGRLDALNAIIAGEAGTVISAARS
jgi:carbamate kinase